ncbi:GNAT family N-acetyltransferase [Saccharibacillus deserti]|uniref:GNAT family N-acetyltransferase n=1 Tax=Saccharibacillus deserti TaxID=1634444 RepID=UPI001557DA56|nr:GNAT family protein [Saccharibacillus deserti]
MRIPMDEPEILQGALVVLAPVEESHRAGLCRVLARPEIWKDTWLPVPSEAELERNFDLMLEQRADKSRIPFVITERRTGSILGTTSLGDIDRVNRGIEIGWTFLSPDYWRTGVNTECKYLLLRHCFERMSVIRVQLSVSSLNLRSQRAVKRIGAVQEGIFRKHRIEPGGPVHDNIFYSVLDTEWPDVRQRLIGLMAKKYESSAGQSAEAHPGTVPAEI